MRKLNALSVFLAFAFGAAAACSSGSSSQPPGTSGPLFSSHAYKGHENDQDMNAFVTAFPLTVGTRLDDCQTCHASATYTYESDGATKSTSKNACDNCHLLQHPSPDFLEPQPSKYADTLNSFGAAYAAAGRSADALRAIAANDSDRDGFSNQEEIDALKYPGDPASKPGQPAAPSRLFAVDELKAMGAHSEFMLANSHKQQYDNYATYVGVKVVDLLAAAGVDPSDAAIEGITVIAPDGYLKDFPAEQIRKAFPAGLFYAGLDSATLGPDCGFVQYPDSLPAGVTDGAPIPGEPWLLLAYERDGLPLDPSNLDVTSGKINGEGPLRIIVPQSSPDRPDRGSQYSPTNCNDGHDYDSSKDHNAGAMVRGVIAVRVNPLPAGFEDFDYANGGWAYVDSESVLVYGYGIQ
ncbi:MAG: hypothetical protein MUF54_09825 [Polyangiaceae bacterium]|nr:hypothetical protein [Polyangiaceae bacterium]